MEISKGAGTDTLDFEVVATPKGGYVAECKRKKLFVEAEDLQGLHDGIQKSVDQAYLKQPSKKPSGKNIRLIVHQIS